MAEHHEFSDRCSYIEAHSWSKGVSKNSFYSKHPHFHHLPSDYNSIPNQNDTNGLIITQNDTQLYITKDLLESLRQLKFINHYGEGPIFNDYPKFHYIGINYIIDHTTSSETQLAWGYCLPNGNVTTAFSKALGESLERQASYYLPGLTSAKFPKQKLSDASYLYNLIPHFTEEQLELNSKLIRGPQDLKGISGFFAKSLTSDKKRFFPFEAFYWGTVVNPQQKILFHPTTSGSGGGLTLNQALVSGWLESIERDHLLLYWFSGIPPKKIDINSLPTTFKNYVTKIINRYNLEIFFLDLSYDTDIITGACVVIDPVHHRITMGAKAGFSGINVLESSLLESLAVLSSTRSRGTPVSEETLKDILKVPPFTKIINRSDRVNLYGSNFGNNLIRDTFLSGSFIPFSDFDKKNLNPYENSYDKQLDYLIKVFEKLVTDKGAGYHAYYHEFDSIWLDRLHYHAAHIFIPSLLKLHLNETLATPVSERLFTFAKEHGKNNLSKETINPLPHFFP